jgi:hypothetical protein
VLRVKGKGERVIASTRLFPHGWVSQAHAAAVALQASDATKAVELEIERERL